MRSWIVQTLLKEGGVGAEPLRSHVQVSGEYGNEKESGVVLPPPLPANSPGSVHVPAVTARSYGYRPYLARSTLPAVKKNKQNKLK